MPRDCTNCAPIAKTSLITGLILVGLGAMDTFLQFGFHWVPQVFLGTAIACFVGVTAGFWGLVSGRGQPPEKSDWVLAFITLLNGTLFATAILVMLF